GRMSVNSLPAPGSDFTVMSPPWRVAISLHRNSPSPVPLMVTFSSVGSLPNRVKSLGMCSAAMPRPWSRTLTETCESRLRVVQQLGFQQPSHGRDLPGRDRPILQHRVVAADQRQRSAELMRREVQKLRFDPLELSHPVSVRAQPGLFSITRRIAHFFLLAALG